MKYLALTVVVAAASVAATLGTFTRPALADGGRVERVEGGFFARLLAAAEHDDDDDRDPVRTRRAAPGPTYAKECGACHVVYPAGLLPAESWRLVMTGLADHFGENAELDAPEQARITEYLVAHAARRGAAVPSLRITDTPWFVRAHHEVPRNRVVSNPKVRSYSNCDACHRDAARGDFDEDRVVIP